MPSASGLLALSRSPEGKKMVRYAATSLICVVINECTLTVLGLLGWSAVGAVLVATAVSTVPSYELNRRWAWGKAGSGHLWKEIVPFWALAFIGLAYSLWAANLGQSVANHHHLSRVLRTGILDGSVIAAYGSLWVGKFIILNKLLFARRPGELSPALDGRSGGPT